MPEEMPMRRWVPFILGGVALAVAACGSERQVPASMRVIVLSAERLPNGDKWNDLLGRPLIEVEYAAEPGQGTGGRTLYLYDGRSDGDSGAK